MTAKRTKDTPKRPSAQGRKTVNVSKETSSERIATHLANFEAAGGTIEVLGVTRTLKHIEPPKSK